MLLLQPACAGDDSVRGVVRVIDATRALGSTELLSVNGTYGAACTDRAGAWSVAIAAGAILDHAVLSVLAGDPSCALALTEQQTASGVFAAVPPIGLTTTYQAVPSRFGTPLAFYGNARLSAPGFAADFVLTILYSDDPRLASADNTAISLSPAVIAETPLDEATSVTIALRPTATFSVTMDPATITPSTFTLAQGATPVSGSVAYDALTRTATFTPDAALLLGTPYEATVTTGARDTRGTPLAASHAWQFTTALCSQARVGVGTASGFGVLGGSTVTSTGLTTVSGDIGVSPGTAVTGFPPGTYSGTLHLGDPTAAAASADLGTAYGEAIGRATCPILEAGELGGRTLLPGLYRAAATLDISAGDLTLDAQGEPDAVFVFQIGSTLTVISGLQVLLVNGAKAGNVFWQVGSSATLGTYSVFAGTILAQTSITVTTGVRVFGRVLAHGGAVTLDTNIITVPGP